MIDIMKLSPKQSNLNIDELTIFSFNISGKELFNIFGVHTKKEYMEGLKDNNQKIKDVLLYLYLKYPQADVDSFINKSFNSKTIQIIKAL